MQPLFFHSISRKFYPTFYIHFFSLVEWGYLNWRLEPVKINRLIDRYTGEWTQKCKCILKRKQKMGKDYLTTVRYRRQLDTVSKCKILIIFGAFWIRITKIIRLLRSFCKGGIFAPQYNRNSWYSDEIFYRVLFKWNFFNGSLEMEVLFVVM